MSDFKVRRNEKKRKTLDAENCGDGHMIALYCPLKRVAALPTPPAFEDKEVLLELLQIRRACIAYTRCMYSVRLR